VIEIQRGERMDILDGKVAVVTGATWVPDGGLNIGGAVASALVDRGARVVAVDKSAEGVEALVSFLNEKQEAERAYAYPVDLRRATAAQELVSWTESTLGGGVDVLVNNAGIFRGDDGTVGTLELDVWEDVLAVNLTAPMRLVQAVLPHMRMSGGSIINTSSTHSFAGDARLSAYGVSKAGLNALTMYVASQYGRERVRCNAICPGTTTSPPVQRLPESARAIHDRNALNPRLNSPQDLANVFAFLASDESLGINGMVLRVDAGLLAHQPFMNDLEALARQ
jgi:NAD(P)-dependent dehydrogenase (short-subunit alcohol dehydrogenase family)